MSLLERLTELEAKATPGPWKYLPPKSEDNGRPSALVIVGKDRRRYTLWGRADGCPFSSDDHALIAALRNAWPEIKAALEQREGWISVKDRLPDCKHPLVYFPENAMGMREEAGQSVIEFPGKWVKRGRVPFSHWMPLPAAPSAQGEKDND